MTCYFRHMKEIFERVGISVTPENKRDIDKQIHRIVGVEYKDCSTTWREIKRRIEVGEDEFIDELKAALSGLM